MPAGFLGRRDTALELVCGADVSWKLICRVGPVDLGGFRKCSFAFILLRRDIIVLHKIFQETPGAMEFPRIPADLDGDRFYHCCHPHSTLGIVDLLDPSQLPHQGCLTRSRPLCCNSLRKSLHFVKSWRAVASPGLGGKDIDMKQPTTNQNAASGLIKFVARKTLSAVFKYSRFFLRVRALTAWLGWGRLREPLVERERRKDQCLLRQLW